MAYPLYSLYSNPYHHQLHECTNSPRPTTYHTTLLPYSTSKSVSVVPSCLTDCAHHISQTFTITGSSSPLKVIHTPGHSDDSISLLLPDQGIFCADTVLGEGTAVFEDLRVYMQSLSTLLEIMENGQEKLFPGRES